MKKTLIAVACATFITTGAMAKPATHQAPKPQNNHSIHMVNHSYKPAPKHVKHHAPAPVQHVAQYRPAPAPVYHHHHHDTGAIVLGDALIAFAILATAF